MRRIITIKRHFSKSKKGKTIVVPTHKRTIKWQEFIKIKFNKNKAAGFPAALKAAGKDWPKAKTMSPEEAKKNYGNWME